MLTYFNEHGDTFRLTLKQSQSNNMNVEHAHDSVEFYILLSGNRRLFVNDSFYELAEGSMFFVKPQTAHRTIDAERTDYESLICNFSESWLNTFFGREGIPTEPELPLRLVLPSKAVCMKVRALTDTIRSALQNQPTGYSLSVYSRVLSLLAIFFQHDNIAREQTIRSESYTRISQIIRYIHAHFSDRIVLSELASRFYISEFHMCRMFKTYTGKTIGEYITSVRIAHACKLLMTTHEKIQVIHTLCGFSSLSNFNKTFRRVCGKTPMQYRKER